MLFALHTLTTHLSHFSMQKRWALPLNSPADSRACCSLEPGRIFLTLLPGGGPDVYPDRAPVHTFSEAYQPNLEKVSAAPMDVRDQHHITLFKRLNLDKEVDEVDQGTVWYRSLFLVRLQKGGSIGDRFAVRVQQNLQNGSAHKEIFFRSLSRFQTFG